MYTPPTWFDGITVASKFASERVAAFTKVPCQGKLKTRLGSHIGTGAALKCYSEMLEHTLTTIQPFKAEIWYAGTLENAGWTRDFPTYQQPKGDLGEKMLAVFRSGCRLLLGCDCPLVSTAYIQDAIERLERFDLVLGPVEDGGYFLIGMNEPRKEIFQDISWSTHKVLEETLSMADQLGLTVSCLPTLWDVDTHEDYQRWLGLHPKELQI